MKVASRIFLAIILLLFILAALAPLAHADESGYRWVNPSVDPYAASRAAAMKKRESAFNSLALPVPVVAQLLRVTERPGERVVIMAGEHFSAMAFKGGAVRFGVITAFDKPLAAEKWAVLWRGVIFAVFLPEGSFNWGSRLSTRRDEAITVRLPFGGDRIQSIVARAT